MNQLDLLNIISKYALYLALACTVTISIASIDHVNRKTAYIEHIANELLKNYPCDPVQKERQ